MFCPKCGDELVRQGDELFCAFGEMGLAQDIERILTKRFSAHSPSPKRREFAPITIEMYPFSSSKPPRFIPLYPWFCPGCGVSLDKKMCCQECAVSIGDLQGPLLERHPHLAPLGKWR
jgi:hypothetical protein